MTIQKAYIIATHRRYLGEVPCAIVLPTNEADWAETALLAAEAAEKARHRTLEVLAWGFGLGCLYFLILSPLSEPLNVGDLLVAGALLTAMISPFCYFYTDAKAQRMIHAEAIDQGRRLMRQRLPQH